MKGDKVLLTQNGPESDHPWQWEFPGGKIKAGESDEACIKREIEEELDLKIKIERRMRAIEHKYSIKTIRLIPFICSISGGTLRLNEHVANKWVHIENLKNENLSEADKRLILIPENKSILKEYTREQMNNSR